MAALVFDSSILIKQSNLVWERKWMRFSIIIVAIRSATCDASSDMQEINEFFIDRTEISIAEFQQFASATGFISRAERAGGGEVYAWGWEQKPGWTWKTPFGVESDTQLPAVHLTYDEATAYCEWRGARLPSEAEWREAAYFEYRDAPGSGFVTEREYPYPTGGSPTGANCLSECEYRPPVSYSD